MSAISSRVAARYLQAEEQQGHLFKSRDEEDETQEAPVEQQAQQQQQALPKSGTGKEMIKGILDQLEAALDKGDQSGFQQLLEKLEAAAV